MTVMRECKKEQAWMTQRLFTWLSGRTSLPRRVIGTSPVPSRRFSALVAACFIVVCPSARGVEEITESRFRADYSAGLEKLRRECSGVRQIEVESVRTVITQTPKKDKPKTFEVKLRLNYASNGDRERYWALYTADDITRVTSESVALKDGDQVIGIRRDSDSSSYYLATDELGGPQAEGLVKGKGEYLYSAFTCFGLGDLSELLSTKRFVVSKVNSTTQNGEALVKVDFICQAVDPKKPPKRGWLLLAPLRSWALRGYEFDADPVKDFKEKYFGNVSYGDYQTSVVPVEVHMGRHSTSPRAVQDIDIVYRITKWSNEPLPRA